MTVSQVQPDLMPLFSGVPSDPELLQSERAQVGAPPRVPRGAKSLLCGKDFILPELIGHADNGDLSIAVEGSLDSTHLSQIFHLAECGEQPSQNFHDLILSEQQLEKRRYFDFLKRIPQEKVERMTRQEELEIWLKRDDPEYSGPAEANFLAWYELKQQRRRGSLLRKANRLANCGKSGRPMDCSNHPEEHQFYGEFKCQTRYCRRCGAEIFSALFNKYIGLWPIIKELLPQSGFRSAIVIAKLDFTAVNLGRMPTPREIREFNQDIRECVKRVTRELGIGSKQYGFLYCDEFGGWDPKRKVHNTNLHAHGVYVGPFIPQQLIADIWAEIRAKRDGARVVWIQKQKIDNPPADFLGCERRRFVRALGHALKYTGKHVSRSDGQRLAELEIAFQGVRRVHTMGLFYHADLLCRLGCDGGTCEHPCGGRCELANGHEGPHRCESHGHENRCPLCNGYLMFPRESGYTSVAVLKNQRRRNLDEIRRQVARDRVFHGPRGPDEFAIGSAA